MIKCPECGVDSAMYRATVSVCPKCGLILDAGELLQLLKNLGFSEGFIKKVEAECTYKRVRYHA